MNYIWKQILLTFVSLILLLASFTKSCYIGTNIFVNVDFLDSRCLNIIAVETELLVGSLLLLGFYRKHLETITFFLFALFSIVSFYKILISDQSCGCFGATNVRPQYIFYLDIVVLSLLWLIKCTRVRHMDVDKVCKPNVHSISSRFRFICIPLVISLTLFTNLMIFKPDAIVGEKYIHCKELEFRGEAIADNNVKSLNITITNKTKTPVTIDGVNTSCNSFSLASTIPISIEPKCHANVRLVKNNLKNVSDNKYRITFYVKKDGLLKKANVIISIKLLRTHRPQT